MLMLGALIFISIYTLRSGISAAYLERLPTFGETTPPEQLPTPDAPVIPEPPSPRTAIPSRPTAAPEPKKPKEHVMPDHPIYKPEPPPPIPVIDNFPLAAAAHSTADLPPIPPWNLSTQNTRPRKDALIHRIYTELEPAAADRRIMGNSRLASRSIYVFENTGTMRSNELGLLTLQNPFYLNHTRLHMYGVNIIVTPTLFSFSQLQNFYLWTAIQNNYTTYFWGHMDVVALSFEDRYKPNPEITANEREYAGL